ETGVITINITDKLRNPRRAEVLGSLALPQNRSPASAVDTHDLEDITALLTVPNHRNLIFGVAALQFLSECVLVGDSRRLWWWPRRNLALSQSKLVQRPLLPVLVLQHHRTILPFGLLLRPFAFTASDLISHPRLLGLHLLELCLSLGQSDRRGLSPLLLRCRGFATSLRLVPQPIDLVSHPGADPCQDVVLHGFLSGSEILFQFEAHSGDLRCCELFDKGRAELCAAPWTDCCRLEATKTLERAQVRPLVVGEFSGLDDHLPPHIPRHVHLELLPARARAAPRGSRARPPGWQLRIDR